MIYVRYDPSTFPKELLDAAKAAQEELEGLATHEERVAFINDNAEIWRAFKEHLRPLSYGKCWYTESPEPASVLEIDHFRPKARAKRAEKNIDEGYTWLAFSPDNFRYSAPRANRRTTDEDTEEVVGKGTWFPLCEGSPKANWNDRCEAHEDPIILDPVKRTDVELIQVGDDGRVRPSNLCMGINKQRVEKSAEYLGLNLPGLLEARRRAMRNVQVACDELIQLQVEAVNSPRPGDQRTVRRQLDQIRNLTCDEAPYSRATRAVLVKHPDVMEAIAASMPL